MAQHLTTAADMVQSLGVIQVADNVGHVLELNGDVSGAFISGRLYIGGSTGNDGIYKAISVTYNGVSTRTEVSLHQSFAPLLSAVADGQVYVLNTPTVTHNLGLRPVAVKVKTNWFGGSDLPAASNVSGLDVNNQARVALFVPELGEFSILSSMTGVHSMDIHIKRN